MSEGVATTWKHPDKIRPGQLKSGPKLAEQMSRLPWGGKDLSVPPAGQRAVPGTGGPPLIGRGLEIMLDSTAFSERVYEKYGPVSWSKGMGIQICMALGPDATQAVLVNADKAYSQTGWEFFIGPFFRRGLMLLDFDEHLLHRRIMQEAFTRPRLATYLETADRLVRRDLETWPAGGGQIHAYPTLKRLSLDIASEVFMGGAERDDAALQKAFIDTVRAGVSAIRVPVPGSRWKRGLDGRVVLEDYFRAQLPAKRKGGSDDLFGALCHVQTEAGETFSDDDVVNHMIFLMMAAHDTTTITTSAVLAALAQHPEWQEKARAQSFELGDGDLTLDSLDQLTVLDLVIKEALRLVAPVPSLARKAIKDTELLGYHIPKGTFMSVSPWFSHYMSEYWTNPKEFDPERFTDPRNEDKSHRFAWVPFGGGAHKCIGMYFGTQEVKMLLHHILRRYRWTVPAGYTVPWDLVALPMPADGFPLTLQPL
jgi:cytochrome P450